MTFFLAGTPALTTSFMESEKFLPTLFSTDGETAAAGFQQFVQYGRRQLTACTASKNIHSQE
jgi:hypothetical protein